MRNLKRALSLVLAVVMVIGLMVVGASAVSYNDFSDREEIVNKDAVSMLTTLGIIEGQPDGSYNPTGNVDRAMMAKMISVALTNNEDCDTLYQNVNSGLTDIAANWARGYINYCYVRGIIAGRGNNTFDPSANVTGVEAAKMLLTALGYDADIEGLVGPDWALNTAAMAQQLGIFRNFTKDVSEPLNRDDAALLIYNALDVEMIQQYSNGYALVYADHRTILSSVFGVIRVEGVVAANEWAQLQETDSDAALREGRTTLEDVIWYDSTTSNTTVPEGIREDDPVTFNVSTPVDMIGKAVTMYVEKTTILANSNVIGIATNDEMNVIHATAATEETLKDLLDGTGIETDRNTQYYVNYGWCEDGATEAVELINQYPNAQLNETNGYYSLNGVEVEVIDNNDDGTAEYVLYTQETLSEVSRYSERNETVTFYAPEIASNGTTSANTVTRDFADVVFVNDAEVSTDDLILYVEYGGRTYISLPTIVTDTMVRVDRDRDSELYITLDNGEEYRQSYIPDAASMRDVELTHFDIDEARDDDMVGFDISYDFILDSNGYVVAVRPAEETVTSYALVLDSAWTQNALSRGGEIKVLRADGTEATYDINWNESRKAFDGVGFAAVPGTPGQPAIPAADNDNSDLDDKLERYLGTRDVLGGNTTGTAAGTLITYSLNEAGDVLTIERVLQGNTFVSNTSSEISNAANPTTTAGVGDNGTIMYADNTENLQYTVSSSGYENGDGNIVVAANGDSKDYAVDLDTVAFYYDEITLADLIPVGMQSDSYAVGTKVAGHTITADDQTARVPGNGKYADTNYDVGVYYGVATGWDDMSNVAAYTKAQVYPVLEKGQGRTYTATDLAEAILFNVAIDTDTSNYMLVLDANAARSDNWELTVVFEDGSVEAITVDEDDLGDLDPDREADFMKAYSYSENADGTYVVGREGVYTGDAVLLQNQTVNFNDADGNMGSLTSRYVALSTNADVWDVTDVERAGDEAVTGSFSRTRVNAVLVVDNGVIRTAWIWDMDDTSTGIDDTNPVPTEVQSIREEAGRIVVYATEGADNRMRVVTEYLRGEGYTNISYTGVNRYNELQFTADDPDGIGVELTTETYWFNSEVIGAQNLSNYNSASELEGGMLLTGGESDFKALWPSAAYTPGATCLVFTFNVRNDNDTVTLTITGENGTMYEESWSNYTAGFQRFYIGTTAPNDGRMYWTGEFPDGNYEWTVTENGTTIASGTFTMDRGY